MFIYLSDEKVAKIPSLGVMAVLTGSKQQDSLSCPTSLKIVRLVLPVCETSCTLALIKRGQKTPSVLHHPSQEGRLRTPLLFPGSPHSSRLEDTGVQFPLLPDQIWISTAGDPGEYSLCIFFGTVFGVHHQQKHVNLQKEWRDGVDILAVEAGDVSVMPAPCWH